MYHYSIVDKKYCIATNASTIEFILLSVKRFVNPYRFLSTLRYNTFVFNIITNNTSNTSRKTFELKLQKHEYEIK